MCESVDIFVLKATGHVGFVLKMVSSVELVVFLYLLHHVPFIMLYIVLPLRILYMVVWIAVTYLQTPRRTQPPSLRPPRGTPPPPLLSQGGQLHLSQGQRTMTTAAETALANMRRVRGMVEQQMKSLEGYMKADAPPAKFKCPICMDECTGVRKVYANTKCGHVLCSGCFVQTLDAMGKCPLCMVPSTKEDFLRIYL